MTIFKVGDKVRIRQCEIYGIPSNKEFLIFEVDIDNDQDGLYTTINIYLFTSSFDSDSYSLREEKGYMVFEPHEIIKV